MTKVNGRRRAALPAAPLDPPDMDRRLLGDKPVGTTLWKLMLVVGIASLSAAAIRAVSDDDLRLVDAAAEQDIVSVRALIREGVDVNTARADGATALLYAAHWNDREMAELFLLAGADPNASDDHGVTPLARACENASLEMVEMLLDAGARPNAAEILSGLTPLMTAVRTGSLDVIGALLRHGADVNAATSKTHNTPLMWAVAGGRTDLVRVLVEAGADVDAATAKGLTLLMIAARGGDIEMAGTLLALGVDVNGTGSADMHPLPFSIVVGQAAFAQFLLERGADPNGAMAGVRALHAAVGNVRPWLAAWNQKHRLVGRSGGVRPDERPALAEALVARGADPNARIMASAVDQDFLATPRRGAFQTYSCGTGDLSGATSLWIAAREANGRPGGKTAAPDRDEDVRVSLIRRLLAAGADHRIATDDGTTPLMVAAGLGQCTNDYTLRRGGPSPSAEAAVAVLLDAGADIRAVNEADFSALHGAAFRGLNEVIQILVDRGADMNARDFRGRTPYRLAQGGKQSFYFQEYPQTAEFIASLGADTTLGLPGTVQERLRDVPDEADSLPQEGLDK